jgi:transcription antitermination protein NusB
MAATMGPVGAAGSAEPSGGSRHLRSRERRELQRARRTAVDVLFLADITAEQPADVVASWRAAGRAVPTHPDHLVDGVTGSLDRIDELLGEHSEGWVVSRMSVVDRAILRTAVFELLDGIPAAIAINEAVEAAESLSTEASGRFVNGVLGAIARALDPGEPPEGRGTAS